MSETAEAVSAGDEVWVIMTHTGWGENAAVRAVCDSREAAWDAMKERPGMTVYAEQDGTLRGRPRKEGLLGEWAEARPMRVRGRRE